jgi:hypothetical protein
MRRKRLREPEREKTSNFYISLSVTKNNTMGFRIIRLSLDYSEYFVTGRQVHLKSFKELPRKPDRPRTAKPDWVDVFNSDYFCIEMI